MKVAIINRTDLNEKIKEIVYNARTIGEPDIILYVMDHMFDDVADYFIKHNAIGVLTLGEEVLFLIGDDVRIQIARIDYYV
jgi:hypothetical protein